jgi:hypothetical protein
MNQRAATDERRGDSQVLLVRRLLRAWSSTEEHVAMGARIWTTTRERLFSEPI